PMHSEIQFKVKHLVISTVTGTFTRFSADVETDGENFETAKIHFSADANSISTGMEQRDGHLKSADFFDAGNFPTIDFISDSVVKKGDAQFTVNGKLTMRGVTKPVSLNVEFGGTMTDPYGNFKAGFEVTGSLKRKEFGLSWDAVTEAGGVVVSDEVKIVANVQFAKVAAEVEKAQA
ncbi:MAG TPA: YceI family protein, partial [Bacteroidia bacterium]|nr:YceI family protein [Bacteroidia bacterium]